MTFAPSRLKRLLRRFYQSSFFPALIVFLTLQFAHYSSSLNIAPLFVGMLSLCVGGWIARLIHDAKMRTLYKTLEDRIAETQSLQDQVRAMHDELEGHLPQ